MANNKNAEAWAEAKKRCRLNAADIQKAKELGMSPKSLIKNIPSPKQQWKAPVKVWINELYEDKFGDRTVKTPKKIEKPKQQEKPVISDIIDDEYLPF
ncbi:hypothetical protein SM124_16390 [Bacillus sp. 31A1R]|uniref:Uncharacterized protein n=1 Tax=Robertmurraya mangrovi TaxID=3098077 RepID=A0ABU5J1K1_9BACI|nr:hypothetical protein [Bacillus sp. 31A1R]MDZ5473298.1 hypothetical protein [Bacillus sp. 31A1R]